MPSLSYEKSKLGALDGNPSMISIISPADNSDSNKCTIEKVVIGRTTGTSK
jgi:hypothetical protein